LNTHNVLANLPQANYHETLNKGKTMNNPKTELKERRCLRSELSALLSDNSSGDLLDVWELFRLKCPWSEHKRSWDETEFSCMAIRYGGGAGRECSMKLCAPFYFVKTLTECAAR